MYTFFKNTGIQYFGNEDVNFTNALELNRVVESFGGDASLAFARKLLTNEWVPLSLDGERNLLRICFLFIDGRSENIFAIDTKISDNLRYFLTQEDLAEAQFLRDLLERGIYFYRQEQ